jgi:hypothetical protein
METKSPYWSAKRLARRADAVEIDTAWWEQFSLQTVSCLAVLRKQEHGENRISVRLRIGGGTRPYWELPLQGILWKEGMPWGQGRTGLTKHNHFDATVLRSPIRRRIGGHGPCPSKPAGGKAFR